MIVDIGGNRGDYSANVIEKFTECELVVFEPAISNAELLSERFRSNPRVKVESKAISKDSGTASLYSNTEGSNLASPTKRRLKHFGVHFSHIEQVATVRFEDYRKNELSARNVDLVKLYIEGHELDALIGMGGSLDFIRIIQFEFGDCNIDTRTYFQVLVLFYKQRVRAVQNYTFWPPKDSKLLGN